MNVYVVKVSVGTGSYWMLYVVQADTEKTAEMIVRKRVTAKHYTLNITRMDFDSTWRKDKIIMIAQDCGQGQGLELFV